MSSLFQAVQSGRARGSTSYGHSHGVSVDSKSLFAGSGFRLGQSDHDHAVITGAGGTNHLSGVKAFSSMDIEDHHGEDYVLA